VLMCNSTCARVKSSFQNLLVNTLSRSEMINSGNPWSLYTELRNNLATEAAEYDASMAGSVQMKANTRDGSIKPN
jgi:hypothetical protein